MFRLCHRLHAAASLRLLFKGLEFSPAGIVSAWFGLHPPLVVGCNHYKNINCHNSLLLGESLDYFNICGNKRCPPERKRCCVVLKLSYGEVKHQSELANPRLRLFYIFLRNSPKMCLLKQMSNRSLRGLLCNLHPHVIHFKI